MNTLYNLRGGSYMHIYVLGRRWRPSMFPHAVHIVAHLRRNLYIVIVLPELAMTTQALDGQEDDERIYE